MDKRTLRSRKSKPRSARPYDRQDQSIFGKVCSTVKGLLNPSWLFGVSQWIGNLEEEQPGGSSDDIEEGNVRDDNDVVSQSVTHGNKRLRLRFDDHTPAIQNSGTQTWNEQPPQNLYDPISRHHIQSSSTQSSLLENKETITVLNGDDHSENSEGSASTSGCSSLVSSHKESNRLAESPFSLLNINKRKESSKPGFNDLNSSRSLWTSSFSPSSKFQRRLSTISHSNQPSFNLSTFVGPSKLNESAEKNISSPFYEGRTTFGGASASRRMPASVAPYQVDKSLRNQIKVREHNSEDNLEGMSSAAKRILLTLEKMSTPVADAKRIPNSDKSPVDLSLYLSPPKSLRNSQFTPSIASRGPPIANINTIAKLATLKNYGTSRLRNTPQNSPVTSVEHKASNLDYLQPSTSETIAQKSGGGKMKNKLNQHHHSSKVASTENEMIDTPILKSVPLPISSLPTINFGTKTEKSGSALVSSKGFKFSNPIEHDLSISNTVPASTLPLPSPYDSFKFSNPIEHELPNKNTLSKEKAPLPTWECSICWVRNSQSKTSCAACETPRDTKENSSGATSCNTSAFSAFQPSQTTNATFKFGTQPSENSVSATETTTGFSFSKKEASNEIPSSVSQKPASSFGSPTTKFVFGSKKDTSDQIPSSNLQTPSLIFGSSKGFAFDKKTECTSTTSQNSTLASSATFVFKNTTIPNFGSSTATTNIDKPGTKTETWECSSCWVKNPMKELKCIACETPRSADSKNKVKTSLAASTSSIMNTEKWECSSCYVKNSVKESKCIACETPRSANSKNSEVKSLVSSAFSTWECTSCWVRNPMKEKKCMACETLHPSADANSGVKDTNGFKFSSPIQNSPITFKFGNYVCTAPSTVTTSSFKFGICTSESQTVTTTSGFKTNAPSSVNTFFSSAVSTAVSKPSEALSNITQSGSTTGFKMPSVASTTAENKQTDQVLNSFACETSEASSKLTIATKTSESNSEPPKVISESKVTGAVEDNITKTVSSSEGTKDTSGITNPFQVDKSNQFQVDKSNPFHVDKNNPFQVDKSSKGEVSDTVINTSSKDKDVPLPSVTACFGFTSQPVESWAPTKKQPSAHHFTFGEKTDTAKTNLSSNSVGLTTATTTSFSFSSNVSNISNSKTAEVSNSVSETHPISVKTDESKIPASVSISAATTSSSYVFGSAVTTSAPSAFSFFPSSSASTSTASVFSFGASPSTTQASKTGGFTFKGLDKPQTTTTTVSTSTLQSTAPVLSVGNTAPAPSGGFMFGATKSEAQNVTPVTFAFGSGATTSSSNTSAFSAFQPSQPTNTSFQFGSQPSGSTASTLGTSTGFTFAKSEAPNQNPSSVSQNPVSAFGSTTTNFVFGSKNETSNQISGSVSQAPSLSFGSSPSFTFNNKTENTNAGSQNPTPAFGSSSTMPSIFGSNSVPQTFDGSDKPSTGGFNFGVPASGVFQFGVSNNAEKKRTATASGFSFGSPAPPETNNSFPTGFTMNTPPSFNFGASSTPAAAGPFQFAASTAAKSSPTQNTRRIKRAVRRVARKE